MQTLRIFYFHGILPPWDLFIAGRSALKRASRWLLKQTIMLSGFRDIGDLMSSNLVITNWSADNLVNTDCLRYFWYCLKGLLKGFWWPFRSSKSVKYSQSYSLNEVCDKRSIKLAGSLKCERSAEISRVSQLLLVVYQGFYQSSSSIIPTSKKERKVEMEKRAGESVLGHKKSIYIRTSTGSTRFGQRNTSWSWCIWLYNRRGVISEIWGWKMEASSIYI